MRMIRLLLPFTHGVDAKAIDHVLYFAKASHATLVALALIPSTQPNGHDVRLERIQQARDFLETISTKAEVAQVPVEVRECFTADLLECVASSVQAASCEGLILLSDTTKTYFLCEDEVQRLVENSPCPLYRLSMYQPKQKPQHQQPFSHLWAQLVHHKPHYAESVGR